MTRTKVSKNSKRNREAANREEKMRNYEMKMDALMTNLDELCKTYLNQVDTQLQMTISLTNTQLLQMKMSDFLELELKCFTDFKIADQTQLFGIGPQSICNTTASISVDASAGSMLTNGALRNDEGYLTEDSNTGAHSNGIGSSQLKAYTSGGSQIQSALRSARALRTPGPLHSARARRGRRSRSACGELISIPSATRQIPVLNTAGTDRLSRNKMRTPLASRSKALSADRTPLKLINNRCSGSPSTPPLAFMRWPKPGEIALSKCGSPMVAQVMPDKFANVNIPIRNGVLSLRPKKLGEIQPDLLESLDSETLSQIKTLHENLNKIVNMADKAGLK